MNLASPCLINLRYDATCSYRTPLVIYVQVDKGGLCTTIQICECDILPIRVLSCKCVAQIVLVQLQSLAPDPFNYKGQIW